MIEVLVALTAFTLVAFSMVAFSRAMIRSWERLRAERDIFQSLLVLDRSIDGILGNAVPFLWNDADGKEVPFFIGGADFVRLACLHPIGYGEDGALRFVEVFVEDGKLVAFHSQRPYLDPEQTAAESAISVLADAVDRVQFRYADWAGDEARDWQGRLDWVDEWDPERPELPLGILMTVHWRDGRVESWLRRTAAAGYRERWGRWQPAKPEG